MVATSIRGYGITEKISSDAWARFNIGAGTGRKPAARLSAATIEHAQRDVGVAPLGSRRGPPSPAPTLPSPASGGGKGGGDLSPQAGRGEAERRRPLTPSRPNTLGRYP